MQRFHLTLLLNVIIGSTLAFVTTQTLRSLHHYDASGFAGWLICSPVGTLFGMLPLVLVFILLFADSFWVLFVVIWLCKRVFHINDDDNTLFLP